MALSFSPLNPNFAAEVGPVDLTAIDDAETLGDLRAAMDKYAVLVFRDQRFDDTSQLAFAERFDSTLHAKTGIAALGPNRFGNEALTDVSNIDDKGQVLPADDRRRQYGLANQLWHTDASFEDPPGRYSMLSARVLPRHGGETEFADMRAAYDALEEDMQARIADLRAHHSIAYSRQVLGFEFSDTEAARLEGVVQPMVRTNPNTGRRSIYVAAHCSRIVDWPLPDGRLLLRELIEHATQREFVYQHQWRLNDFVIWDNLATMHRGRPYDVTEPRELRRVTSLNI